MERGGPFVSGPPGFARAVVVCYRNDMLKRLVLVVVAGLVLAQGAVAGRILPQDAQVGQLEGVDYPSVKIDGHVHRLAPGVVIFGQSNRTILPTYLPQAAKIYYKVDLQGQLTKIWIMTPDEEARLK